MFVSPILPIHLPSLTLDSLIFLTTFFLSSFSEDSIEKVSREIFYLNSVNTFCKFGGAKISRKVLQMYKKFKKRRRY
jgi:hypothetical protein